MPGFGLSDSAYAAPANTLWNVASASAEVSRRSSVR